MCTFDEVGHLRGELLCDLLLAARLYVVCGLGATIDYYYYCPGVLVLQVPIRRGCAYYEAS